MSEKIKISKVDSVATIFAVSSTLRKIDARLIDHGERVAFIACELFDAGNLNLDKKMLFLLSIFHDIGAYKTDEIDRMVQFETTDAENHSIYGYLFLKYMTPIKEFAEAILYHHSSWQEIVKTNTKYGEYAALIHIADRIDIALLCGPNSPEFKSLINNDRSLFREEYVNLVQSCYEKSKLYKNLSDGSYKNKIIEICKSFNPTAKEATEYLKMIVNTIDFRSEFTVTHTINTVAVALNIARHFGLDEETQEKVYLASLLHDVGKIAIPAEILESKGKLTEKEMDIMRTHVTETENLIKGVVPDDICEMAIRHHEKLDGSGYPNKLTAKDLTFCQRIIAVSDIVSALSGRRSYKQAFPKDLTVKILQEMSERQLDKTICEYVCENYDQIMELTEPDREKVIAQYQSLIDEYNCMLKNRISE